MVVVKDEHLLDCGHCDGSGTCRSGIDGTSCAACMIAHNLKPYRFLFFKTSYSGLRCGGCNGLLKSDSASVRMQSRIGPILAISTLGGLATVTLFAVVLDKSLLAQVITGWLSLASSMTAFYFSKKKDS